MSAKRRGGKNNAGKGQRFELTDEQKLEIREAFDLFDTDGSGACLSTAHPPLLVENVNRNITANGSHSISLNGARSFSAVGFGSCCCDPYRFSKDDTSILGVKH